MLSPVSRISAARPGPTSAGRSAAWITEGHAHPHLGQSERRARGGRPHVAGHGQLEPGAQARAVDHRHRGKRRLVHRLDGFVERRDEWLGADGGQLDEELKLHAGGHRAPRARHDRRAHRRIAREPVERRLETT